MLARRTTNLHCKQLMFIAFPLYTNLSTQVLSKNSKKSKTFVVHCNSLISQHGRNGNLKESESVFNRLSFKNPVSYTAMLTAYAQNGQITKAREVFDEMPQRTTGSYNAMITAYTRNNDCMIDEAFALFSQMDNRNAVSYATMITGFLRMGKFDNAEELYGQMPLEWRDPVCSNAMISGYLKAGRFEEAVRVFRDMVHKDVVSWSSIVNGYCKKGRIVEARELFDRMSERNVVTWTAIIDGYMNAGCFQDGFGLFLSMRREGSVSVNATTLTVMFEACRHFGRYREGMQMHSLVLRIGFLFDVFLGNSIMTMYGRFGCLDEANRIFHMMNRKDVVSWNSMISGYVQLGQIKEAYELFKQMPGKDVVSWTTMIAGYSGVGEVEKTVQLFEMMPEKDDIAWTAVISGFVSNGEYEEAFCWFVEMLKKAVRPNALTLSSVLSASASLATLNQGLQIHAVAIKMELESNLSIQNSLVSMYSKCGNVIEAYGIFTTINEPNLVSFNSMITGFGQNGHGKDALRLLSTMQNKNLKPNEITFLGVLSACTHMGLVEEGWKYFNSMRSVYDIKPGPDHYACMVDLLGRAGLLDEAIDLIHSMPFEPHSGVWGALLGASRMHFCIDVAKIASQHVTELEPDNAIPYVVLSDLYNIAGKKNDAQRVRIIKKSKQIVKSPGCSWIIVKDKVNLFLSGDQSCMNLEEIKHILWIIAKEMSWLTCQEW